MHNPISDVTKDLNPDYLRNMQFGDIVGQASLIEKLKELVDQNRLSHSILLYGKEGSGALPLALAFATYVIEKTENVSDAAAVSLFGEPMERASEGALKADRYLHPDVHYSYPVIPRKPGDKPVAGDYITEWRNFLQQTPYGNVYDWLQSIGAENKQGNITAAECEDILRKLQLKSFESGYKILMMWMPEYLGNEGNKLLKLIEEPPPNTLFILVAEQEDQILATLLSRSQLIRVPPIEQADIAQALVQRCGVEAERAGQIAAMSEGNYRLALHLLQHGESDWQPVLREWLNTLIKADTVAQVKWADEMHQQGRENQKQFLHYFEHLVEQAVRLSVLGENYLTILEREKDFCGRLNKLCDVAQLEALAKELNKAAYFIERNANAKMLFTALSIKFFHIIRHRVMPEVR